VARRATNSKLHLVWHAMPMGVKNFLFVLLAGLSNHTVSKAKCLRLWDLIIPTIRQHG